MAVTAQSQARGLKVAGRAGRFGGGERCGTAAGPGNHRRPTARRATVTVAIQTYALVQYLKQQLLTKLERPCCFHDHWRPQIETCMRWASGRGALAAAMC
ncbi:hypothetical protein Bbelb_207390 [Branchiostoma belcheri]|nr:hypothetical protein Bbelb_207390 [Branchiostoma belcheri]